MEKNLTELVFILDKSGSMWSLSDDTIGGYNALLKQNKMMEGEALVSTVLFNHKSQVLHDRVPIEDVAPLTSRDYVPSGCTALLDAVGGAIHYHKHVQRILPPELHPEHTLFCITTDGLENASKEYSYDRVKRMISAAQERGWDFMFLGANIDVAKEADRLGIREDRAMPYEPTSDGMLFAFDTLCRASAAVRCGEPIGVDDH